MRDQKPKSTQVTLRAARKGEHKILGQIAHRAFQVGESVKWERYFREHPHHRSRDTRVAKVGPTIAGHATALRLTMSLCGKDVPMAGVAAVAVSPEYRREGVADALMREILAYVRDRKVALSMLYAFRESFYRKYGYGDVESLDAIRVTPDQLPSSRLRQEVRRASPKDRPAIKRVYERRRAGTSGQFERSAWWWKIRVFERASEQLVFVDPRSKRVTGYLLYSVPDQPAFPNQTCRVVELQALDGQAYRGLLGTLNALGDQFDTIEMNLPPGEALFSLEYRGVFGLPPGLAPMEATGFLGGGAMLRIVRLSDAVAQHPAPAKNGVRGSLGLDLEDPVFQENSGAFDLTFGPKGGRVVPGKRARRRVSLRIDRLAQIYAGTLSARRLLDTGFIEGSKTAAALLDDAFAGPALYLGPGNAF